MSENYCVTCDGHNHQSKNCPNKPRLKFKELFGIMPDFTGNLSTEEYLSGIRGESVPNQVNYISAGKTVGIYVYINGEKQLFTLESELREQIARDIEGLTCTTRHPTILVQCGCDAEQYAYKRAANIARVKR